MVKTPQTGTRPVGAPQRPQHAHTDLLSLFQFLLQGVAIQRMTCSSLRSSRISLFYADTAQMSAGADPCSTFMVCAARPTSVLVDDDALLVQELPHLLDLCTTSFASAPVGIC